MVLTYNQVICKQIKTDLETAVNEAKERLANGVAHEISVYREQVGLIRGLRQAIEICDEAESELQKRERGID